MLKIGRITLDNVTWTAIRPPIDCYHLRLYNPNTVGIKFRTLDTDASSELSINSLNDFSIKGTRALHLHTGSIVGYGQLVSGGPSSVVLIAEN